MRNGDHVKAAGTPGVLRMAGEEALRGVDQTALLAAVHAFGGADQAACGALAYLDKHQGRVIEHDQIQLTAAYMEIARDQRQLLALKVVQRQIFRLASGLLARRCFHRVFARAVA